MSKQVSITIDGRAVSVGVGLTVLEAAREVGIGIPALCAHPRLGTGGACRVCVVEVEGCAELVAACETSIADGMAVQTASDRVLEARRLAVELLLSDHSVECLSCEGNGECELQALAYQLGIKRPSLESLPRRRGVDDSSPVILRDLDKCIVCGRCVAVCNDVDRHDALRMVGEGVEASVAGVSAADPEQTAPMGESRCVSCGDCVQVCPTAALVEKHLAGRARPWEQEEARSRCPFCGVGCDLVLHTTGGQIARVSGDRDGSLCARGRFGCTFVNHADRLTRPMIRRGGRLVEASWDEALDFAAKRLRAAVRKRGNTVGVLSGGMGTNEEGYLLQKLARTVLQTNNIDSRTGYVLETPALKLGGIDECERADTILVIGADPEATAPMLVSAVKRAADGAATLIVAQPSDGELTRWARHVLETSVGREGPLLAGLVAEVLQQQEQEEGLVRTVWEGLDELRASARRGRAGVATEEIRAASRALLESKRLVVLCGDGRLASGLNNLPLLLEGCESSVCWTQAQCNSVGAALMGVLPGHLPDGVPVTDDAERERLSARWGAPVPGAEGLSERELLGPPNRESLRALYVVGANPAARWVSEEIREALSRLDVLICQDVLFTETAQMADVVLPTASFAEKAGMFTNCAGVAQSFSPVLEPPGEARPDWEIIGRLGLRLGAEVHYNGIDEVRLEMAQASPSCADAVTDGGRLLCSEPATPRFVSLESAHEGDEPSPGLAFELVIAPSSVHWRTGAMSRRSPALHALAPTAEARLHPADAETLGAKPGSLVEISNDMAEIRCAAQLDARVAEGVVVVSPHFAEANAMALLGDGTEPDRAATGRGKLPKVGR